MACASLPAPLPPDAADIMRFPPLPPMPCAMLLALATPAIAVCSAIVAVPPPWPVPPELADADARRAATAAGKEAAAARAADARGIGDHAARGRRPAIDIDRGVAAGPAAAAARRTGRPAEARRVEEFAARTAGPCGVGEDDAGVDHRRAADGDRRSAALACAAETAGDDVRRIIVIAFGAFAAETIGGCDHIGRR